MNFSWENNFHHFRKAPERMHKHRYTASAIFSFLAKQSIGLRMSASVAVQLLLVWLLAWFRQCNFVCKQIPVLCEVLPAVGGMNENRENSHFALLQILTCPDLWLFPVLHTEDFISSNVQVLC